MKNIKFIITILIMFIQTSFLSVYADDDCDDDNQKQSIVINSIINIELGDLIKGYVKNIFETEQIIKFEITCKTNKRIRITKIKDVGNSFVKFTTEWKCGAYTGFENNFSGDGIYLTQDKKYYVTMKIKSVEVYTFAPTGKYTFGPEISVEFVDL